MKRFTKLFMTLALLCVAGSVSAQEQVHATWNGTYATDQATWNASTKTFTWKATWSNQIKSIGLPMGDISDYKKLVIDCDIKSGERFRILFYKGGSNITLFVTQSGVTEFNIYEELKKANENDYASFILDCTEICLSGNNSTGSGEVTVNDVYLETYAPDEEKPQIVLAADEEDPGKPDGDFVEFTTAFPSLSPKIGMGSNGHPIVLGNGEVVVGARSKDVIADLSAYSKLTMVTSPNLKLVLYMNHEVDAQQNAGDYAAENEGKYVFLEVQANENGIAEVDLTQFAKQDLNCICLPWDNSNKGTVWYLLLTENDDPLAFAKNELSKAIASGNAVNAFGKTADSFGALTSAISDGESALETATTVEALEAAAQAITNAISALELAEGYSNLTSGMFLHYSSVETPGEGTSAGCSFELGKASDLPYGDSTVSELNWADLSDYGQLIVVVNGNTKPRFCINRLVANGQQAATQEESKMLDINDNNGNTWSAEKYQTIDGNIYTIDLQKIVADYGFARLHCIKKQGWGDGVFVTDILLTEATSVPVTIGEAGYATFCSKKAVALETAMEAYAVEFAGTSAQLIPVEGSVNANTPVILKAEAGSYDLNIAESGASPEKNDLKVSDGTVAGNGSIYVLANGTSGVGFYLLADDVKIPAGKAYLEVNAGGREFIGFGDATAIKSVETVKVNGAVYNLAGQQVKKAQKGIFIIDGKKVIK